MQMTMAPTRSNLLRLTDDLKFAQLGHELLDQKRSILVVELLTLVDQAVDYQNRVQEALAQANGSLSKSIMRMGRLKVANLSEPSTSTIPLRSAQGKSWASGSRKWKPPSRTTVHISPVRNLNHQRVDCRQIPAGVGTDG